MTTVSSQFLLKKNKKPSGQAEGVQQALIKILDIREKETEELKKKIRKVRKQDRL